MDVVSKKEFENSMKSMRKVFLGLLFFVIVANFITFFMYVGHKDNKKIDTLKEELVKVKYELEVERERADMLQKKYDEASSIIRELQEIQKHEEIKVTKYNSIIERSKRYPNSNTDYLNDEFIGTVFDMCETRNVNPYIVFAVIDVESNFHSNAKNKSGAIGLGQITPGTGAFIKKNLMKKSEAYVHDALLSPSLNVQYIVEYLDYLLKRHSNYDRAIKQYCGGFAKGRENYYETKYRPKLLNSMNSFGLDYEMSNILLTQKRIN